MALELPDEVRAELLGWQGRALAGRDGLRAVRPESLHVTLCFLGSRPVSEAGAIARACDEALAGRASATMRTACGLWLPRRRPRVLAVGLEDRSGAGADVQMALEQRLATEGYYEPESRPFLPHVTVARVRRGARVVADELPAVTEQAFRADRVTLYRSLLGGGGGARYEPLHRVTLIAGGR